MKKQPNLIPLVVVFTAITLPYLLAILLQGQDHVFIGFLINPVDGASYLAKMFQGWSGSWRFTLPFTDQPGQGAYLFLFYLFLGHLAKWIGLPLILVFHAARLAGAALLMWAMIRFLDLFFAGRPDLYRMALWLAAIGSGSGWLLLLFGVVPTDFWVAEAYPFLAMFTNPHFPFGLGLLILSFTLFLKEETAARNLWLLIIGLLLSIILPFGIVIGLLTAAAWILWTWIETRKLFWRPIICFGLLGGPFLLYQYWASLTDPVLAVWNAQNVTPSPAVWDFLLSFSPVLILAFFGVYSLWRKTENKPRRILLPWFVLGLVLIYFPFPLQRRFMLGFYIPVTILAVYGVDYLRCKAERGVRWLSPAVVALSIPTNLILMIIALFGILSQSSFLYLSRDEVTALRWIQNETPERSLIIASPEMGGLIPAFTGRRVLYGHPFETVNAEQEKQAVEDFYEGQSNAAEGIGLITRKQVNFVMDGPRERTLDLKVDLSSYFLAFETGKVRIYSTQGTR